jgi:hypothetical protein
VGQVMKRVLVLYRIGMLMCSQELAYAEINESRFLSSYPVSLRLILMLSVKLLYLTVGHSDWWPIGYYVILTNSVELSTA